MKIEDLEIKAKQIDELNIYQSDYDSNIYYYGISTNNKDVKEHLENIMKNIELEDVFYLSKENGWIRKKIIIDAVNIIKNANKYEDINYSSMENLPFIREINYGHIQDMTTSVHIYFKKNNPYWNSIRNLIEKMLQDTDYIKAEGYNYGIHITNKNIDEKENCKHLCKTHYKIKKIDEIFELGD